MYNKKGWLPMPIKKKKVGKKPISSKKVIKSNKELDSTQNSDVDSSE